MILEENPIRLDGYGFARGTQTLKPILGDAVDHGVHNLDVDLLERLYSKNCNLLLIR
jgi:hypothetical protein